MASKWHVARTNGGFHLAVEASSRGLSSARAKGLIRVGEPLASLAHAHAAAQALNESRGRPTVQVAPAPVAVDRSPLRLLPHSKTWLTDGKGLVISKMAKNKYAVTHQGVSMGVVKKNPKSGWKIDAYHSGGADKWTALAVQLLDEHFAVHPGESAPGR